MSIIPNDIPCDNHEIDLDSAVIEEVCESTMHITFNCSCCGILGKATVSRIEWEKE